MLQVARCKRRKKMAVGKAKHRTESEWNNMLKGTQSNST